MPLLGVASHDVHRRLQGLDGDLLNVPDPRQSLSDLESGVHYGLRVEPEREAFDAALQNFE
jgi:hypothetical protein